MQWAVAALTALYLDASGRFAILHRSRWVGTDWVGDAGDIFFFPLIATALFGIHRFGKRREEENSWQQELRRRLMMAEQMVALFVIALVLYWNV